jgi:hypothetical protein
MESPTLKALAEALFILFTSFRRTCLIIDALDECTERQEILNLLVEVDGHSFDMVNMLVTSRKERRIEGY